jgi:4-hydroxybenzoate polyprenyltransferase
VTIAALAGGGAGVALRLGASMLALQASIGAVNDLADVDVDRGRKPGKPMPRGVVRPIEARTVAAVALVLGLALSAVSGLGTAAVAAAGVGLGYLYDLRLSRTPWSWLPLAVALPLLPIHAWLGTTGSIPASLAILVPVAILAGAGLALGNGLADLERDEAAGVATAVVALGRGRAWLIHTAALLAVVVLAWAIGPGRPGGEAALWPVVTALGSALVAGGVLLERGGSAARRERGWELEAVGIAALGMAWVAGIAT